MEIFDAHSHLGDDYFWPNKGKAEEYINEAKKIGITEANVMPVGCPVIKLQDGSKKILSIYKIDNNTTNYYTGYITNNGIEYLPSIEHTNPYKEANDEVYLITKNNDFKFNYIPLIHPKYYSLNELENEIKRKPIMFKLHGIACGIDPKNISQEFLEILESLNIPLLVHTDYSNEKNILSDNSAMNWLKVLDKYNLKCYFAHAARLSKEAIEIINKDSRYIIGIGPDMYLNDGNKNEICGNYIQECLSLIDINKMVFDIDYPWNIKGDNQYDFDWESKDRFDNLLNESEKQKVLCKNFRNFINK